MASPGHSFSPIFLLLACCTSPICVSTWVSQKGTTHYHKLPKANSSNRPTATRRAQSQSGSLYPISAGAALASLELHGNPRGSPSSGLAWGADRSSTRWRACGEKTRQDGAVSEALADVRQVLENWWRQQVPVVCVWSGSCNDQHERCTCGNEDCRARKHVLDTTSWQCLARAEVEADNRTGWRYHTCNATRGRTRRRLR